MSILCYPPPKMIVEIGDIMDDRVCKVRQLRRAETPEEVLVHCKSTFIGYHFGRELVQIALNGCI